MTEALIVSACRTPIGTAGRGALADTSAFDLAHVVLEETLKRTGLAPELFDDVVLGESMYGGGAVARHAALTVGMTSVPGLALNRHCATSLSAVATAAGSVKADMDRCVVAGGTNSASTSPQTLWRTPHTQDWVRGVSPTHPDRPDAPNLDMSISVGWNTAQRAALTREEMDAWAYESHQKAIRAIDEGRFANEVVPMEVTAADGSVTVFDTDEHPRRDTSLEKLASLKVLHPEIEGFSITAGNAAGSNDGAAAVTVASEAFAQEHGLTPLAVVRSWAAVGVDPAVMGLAPEVAIPKALSRAGLSLDDVDLFEINEAFASVPVAMSKRLGIDPAKINPNGSGCSLGHPVAASGARMIVTLLHELRRRGGGVGMAAMCAGGGMGGAVVLEVLAP